MANWPRPMAMDCLPNCSLAYNLFDSRYRQNPAADVDDGVTSIIRIGPAAPWQSKQNDGK